MVCIIFNVNRKRKKKTPGNLLKENLAIIDLLRK
jgi:hypothetical protein